MTQHKCRSTDNSNSLPFIDDLHVEVVMDEDKEENGDYNGAFVCTSLT